MAATQQLTDMLLRVRGTVQGVGFRPFVLRLATELGISGWVRNDPKGVLVRAVGESVKLERFAEQVVSRAPEAARVTAVEWIRRRFNGAGRGGVLHNRECGHRRRDTDGRSGDLAPCADVDANSLTPATPKGYPFINCTQCGPRYSIIESLPVRQPNHDNALFRMCPRCETEYRDPLNRRFHAEPNACPKCGPRLLLSDPAGRPLATGEASLKRPRRLPRKDCRGQGGRRVPPDGGRLGRSTVAEPSPPKASRRKAARGNVQRHGNASRVGPASRSRRSAP